MKENKSYQVGIRLTEFQYQYVQKLIEDGTYKTMAAAIQALINKQIMMG
ncbi:hypothetical protein ACSTWI_000820 [Escherichia coli]|nr:hypothetical protein [Escherichia coli]